MQQSFRQDTQLTSTDYIFNWHRFFLAIFKERETFHFCNLHRIVRFNETACVHEFRIRERKKNMNFTFIFYNKKKKKNVRTFNLAIKNVN